MRAALVRRARRNGAPGPRKPALHDRRRERMIFRRGQKGCTSSKDKARGFAVLPGTRMPPTLPDHSAYKRRPGPIAVPVMEVGHEEDPHGCGCAGLFWLG